MNDNQLIELKVKDFISKDEMFTSVDIANAIKNTGVFIRNIQVAEWLRNNFSDADLFAGYMISFIQVNGGQQTARLYHPNHKDPDNYATRDQVALTPDDVDKIKNNSIKTVLKAVPTVQKNKKNNSKPKSSSNGAVKKYRISSLERIKIPGEITRQLGFKPGDKVEPSKIVAKNAKLPDKLSVNSDFRISIPRNCVPWGVAPVNVFLDNNVICFEKA